MEYDELRPDPGAEELQNEYEDRPETGGRGAFLALFLSLLLIGAGAVIFYRDMGRDLRH